MKKVQQRVKKKKKGGGKEKGIGEKTNWDRLLIA